MAKDVALAEVVETVEDTLRKPEPDGPSPEEQAMVDEEQKVLVAKMRKDKAAAKKTELDDVAAKQQRAAVARNTQIDRLAALEARIAALEAKNG